MPQTVVPTTAWTTATDQLYRLVLSLAFGLSALMVFDAFIVWLTWREWRQQSADRGVGLS